MSQNSGGIIVSPKKILIQLIFILKILEVGSKTENRFVIIFSVMRV